MFNPAPLQNEVPMFNPELLETALRNAVDERRRREHRSALMLSYTKKGPGRRHNYSGLDRKFYNKDGSPKLSMANEFDLRMKLNRFTKEFRKRADDFVPDIGQRSLPFFNLIVAKFKTFLRRN